MKFLILLYSFYSFATGLYSQVPPAFTTDEACLKFIRDKIPGMQNFFFDTLFSKSEKTQLVPVFKSWQRIDMNADKKPDLIFTGAFRDKYAEHNTAMIYFSDGNTYKLAPIVRNARTSFRPHVFTQKSKDQLLIIVHNYHASEFEKVETLLINQELSRETCAGDDTLVFRHNALLDYSTHPSKTEFDSLVLFKKYGWSCVVDSFVVYNSGGGIFDSRCRKQYPNAVSFQESSGNIEYLRYLIRTIDLIKTQRKSAYGGTDNNSATLFIYHGNKVERFSDYGLESSFTLKAIYKYFDGIKERL